MTLRIHTLALLCVALLAPAARAATITIDMNGFPNAAGGQVTGAGITEPIKMKAGEPKVVLENLQAGKTYYIDFFHNAGPGSSDFLITIDKDGKGVDSVTRGGELYDMLVGFTPGATTLKLKTHEIIFNANNALTAVYYIHGLLPAYSLPESAGPQKFKALPGVYPVDVLSNAGAASEDYTFIVDADGNTAPGSSATFDEDNKWKTVPNDREHAVCLRQSISPRAALVHFRIAGPIPLGFHPTHPVANVKTEGGNTEFDMVLSVGAGGVSIYTFGPCKVLKSNMLNAFGKPYEGASAENDLRFIPRLRYSLVDDRYYFESTQGAAQTVTADAEGFGDDKTTAIKGVTLTATIVKPDATAAMTQPANATAPAK